MTLRRWIVYFMACAVSAPGYAAGLEEARYLVATSKERVHRTMREFAEQELVLYTGPYAGRRFQVSRQPVLGLILDEIDSGRWNEFVITGPSQSAKTTVGFICPTLYHLFERAEDVICGVPDLNMVRDKWEKSIRPAIEATRYRDLLPTKGTGSRGGGNMSSVTFTNGTSLRFMTAGGDDKNRAHYTGRVLVVTEVEAFGESSEKSSEANKLEQLRARQRSWPAEQRTTYLECTVGTKEGVTWRHYLQGTASRIALQCPKCLKWSAPACDDSDRKVLTGWEDAEDVMTARDGAAFACPLCGERWTEDERIDANRNAKLVHRGQELNEDGTILGESVRTHALGFRWSAVNNAFLSAADIAQDEWEARRARDADNAARKQAQFVWALPYIPESCDVTPLNPEEIEARKDSFFHRGIVPKETKFFTLGVDLGKYRYHWLVAGWQPDGSPHVVDYGAAEIPTDQLGVERATLVALRELREFAMSGWIWPDGKAKDGKRRPDQVWIDSNYHESQPAVIAFCRESNAQLGSEIFRPTIGRSATQQRGSGYTKPKQTTAVTLFIGEEFHIVYHKADAIRLIEVNADYWKSWLHERLKTPVGQPGALRFFDSPKRDEHHAISRHFTNEKMVEEFVPGRGMVIRWERVKRDNHWLDCAYLACAAASFCGNKIVQLETPTVAASRAVVRRNGFRMPDGRPFFVHERTR